MPEYCYSPRCFICWSSLPYRLDGPCWSDEMRYSIMRDCWNYVLLVNVVLHSRKMLLAQCRSILVEFSAWLLIFSIPIVLPWDRPAIFFETFANRFPTYSSMTNFIYFCQAWFMLLQSLMSCAVLSNHITGLRLTLLTRRWYRFRSSSS